MSHSKDEDCGCRCDWCKSLGCGESYRTSRPWPGYCQNCYAELDPPNATACATCYASDDDE